MSVELELPADLLDSLRRRAGGLSASVLASLFPAQAEFVLDPSPLKAALCSRRAGKSHGVDAWLLEGADKAPGGMSAFIGLSKAHARRVAWSSFKKLDRVFKLGLEFGEQDGQLQVKHPNGHTIWLAGCGDASEIDKFRGATDGFTRVAIDEAQAFAGFLQELVEDAIEPALLDCNGQLALTGTPGPVCAGYFHAITTGDGLEQWPTHHWTVLDNHSIPHAETWLAARRLKRGWATDHPTYRREWLGQWVNDSGALVYPLCRALNHHVGPLPSGQWVYALGVDLGFADATAFVLLATRRGSGEVFVLEAEKRSGMLPQAIGARILQYRSRFRLQAVVVDEGGLGKGYAEQMRADGVQCQPAEKTTKRAAQEWLRGMVLAGAVKVDWTNARALVDECSVLSWGDDGKAEDPRFDNHAADAFLYATRALMPFYRPELEPPLVGTAEWHLAQQAAWKAREIADREKRQRREKQTDLVRRLANMR